MSDIRDADIDDLRRKMKGMGRPMKTDIIRSKDDELIFFGVNKKGKVRIKEVVEQKE